MNETLKGTVTLRCDCGQVYLVVDKHHYEESKYGPAETDFAVSMYHSACYDFVNNLSSRIKTAWKILTGERIPYLDLYIEDINIMKKFAADLNDLVNSDE
jgi:hypothetical protein